MKAESGYALEMLIGWGAKFIVTCGGARHIATERECSVRRCDEPQIDVRQKCSVVRRSAIERRKRMDGV